MRIGMICRYDNSGLGTLSREFVENLHPNRILLVSNGVFQTFPERYAGYNYRIIPSTKSILKADLEWFLRDIDIVVSFETFYNWGLVYEAKRREIKTCLVTMFEMTMEFIPDYPDIFICPSKLDYTVFQKYKTKSRIEFLPVPVCTDHLKWRQRKKAKIFTHIASHGGVSGRKGTQLLISSLKHVQNRDIMFIIYTWKDLECDDSRVEIKKQNFKDYWQCWEYGDVLVYPQDFNGICLPIVEALSSGMGVISTDIFPFNEYLPKDLLFKPIDFYKTRVGESLIQVDAAIINPKSIAEKIDQIAGQDISRYSNYGKKWAEENSWYKLGPKYLQLFQDICQIQ